MSITLRPETEQRIAARMTSGRYSSPDDVVQDGLKLLEDREQARRRNAEEVRRKIALGVEQLERGEGIDGDEVFASLLMELESADPGE